MWVSVLPFQIFWLGCARWLGDWLCVGERQKVPENPITFDLKQAVSTLAGLRAAFERCNPKSMSRVMADMRRNNTQHASSRQWEQRQQLCPTIGVPRFGYRSSENAYLRMYVCVYVCTTTVVSASYEYLVCVYDTCIL